LISASGRGDSTIFFIKTGEVKRIRITQTCCDLLDGQVWVSAEIFVCPVKFHFDLGLFEAFSHVFTEKMRYGRRAAMEDGGGLGEGEILFGIFIKMGEQGLQGVLITDVDKLLGGDVADEDAEEIQYLIGEGGRVVGDLVKG
jgi:hypothetical protein